MANREQRPLRSAADLVAWFRAQHGRWANSTVRQYRAAIIFQIEERVRSADFRALLLAQVRRGPDPKTGGPPRTSACKWKTLPFPEFGRLMTFLSTSSRSDDHLIAGFIGHGVFLFLRPVEYLNAGFDAMILKVQNAKATNGRGNGKQRERWLDGYDAPALDKLRKFLTHIGEEVQRTGSWAKLRNRLASRLARVCRSLGISRVSLYTIRHVSMSTAKRSMLPQEVAACAGHGSVRTATSHYARKSSGWRNLPSAGPPGAASVGRVNMTAKVSRPVAGQAPLQRPG
jgi:hypothetical protein